MVLERTEIVPLYHLALVFAQELRFSYAHLNSTYNYGHGPWAQLPLFLLSTKGKMYYPFSYPHLSVLF